MRVSERGCRSALPLGAFLSLFNNGILSDTDTPPVNHFYCLVFCHFRPAVRATDRPAHLHMNVGVCSCRQIVICSQVDSSLLLPLAHGDTTLLPPSASHCEHPRGVTDRNQSRAFSGFAPRPAQRLLLNAAIVFKRALPPGHLPADISLPEVPTKSLFFSHHLSHGLTLTATSTHPAFFLIVPLIKANFSILPINTL